MQEGYEKVETEQCFIFMVKLISILWWHRSMELGMALCGLFEPLINRKSPLKKPKVSSVFFFAFSFFVWILPLFLPNFMVSNCTILSHRYNSHTGSGETKVESHASSDTPPNQAAHPTQKPATPMCQRKHRQPLLAHTVPSPPQESLVHNETRTSLPAKPSLTRTTLGQLSIAPWTSPLQHSLRARARTQTLWSHSRHCRTAPETTAPPGRPTQTHFVSVSYIDYCFVDGPRVTSNKYTFPRSHLGHTQSKDWIN